MPDLMPAAAATAVPPTLSVAEIRSPKFEAMQKQAYANDLARLHTRLNEFVPVACPACGQTAAAKAFDKYRCQFVRCHDCQTLYMSPRPTPDVMDDYYSHSENYRIWGEYIFPASEDRRREKICKPMLQSILAACTQHGVAPRHLMEVGPGFGTFAALARSSGAFERVSAVERTPAMAQACRRHGIEVHEMAVEDLPASFDDPADVLVFFEVIEHIFDPKAFLRTGARLLRQGGLLVLTCPNGAGFDTQVLGADSVAVDTEHVNLFNPQSLSLLMERLGFDVLEVSTPGRLDAELVREAILAGQFDVSHQPFLRQVLVDEFDRLGGPFQRFLADNGLSGNMRLIARKR